MLYSTPGMGNPDAINDSREIFIEVTKLLTPESFARYRSSKISPRAFREAGCSPASTRV